MAIARRWGALCLAVVFATALYGARVLWTGHTTFGFLLWNLVLALIPVALAAPRRGGIARLAAWMLFFPNAPYIVTDLVHLRPRSVPLWFDVGMLSAFAWAGLLAACLSLDRMRRRVDDRYGRRVGWVFVSATALLSGFGIWLGRFVRLNSWDVVLHPSALLHAALRPVMDPFGSAHAWAVTLLFGGFIFVVYASFSGAREDRAI